MSYTRKAVFGFAWAAGGTFVASVFAYLLRLLLARSLTLAEYGIVYAVISLFSFLSIFTHFGLREAVMKFTAEYMVEKRIDRVREVFGWAARGLFLASIAVALLTSAFSVWLASVYLGDAAAWGLIVIYAAATLLSPVNALFTGFVSGLQRMDLNGWFEGIRSFLLFCVTALLLFYGFRAGGALMAYVIVTALLYLCFCWPGYAPKGFFSMRVSMERSTMRRLVSYGIPVTLASFAAAILSYTDTIILTLFSNLDEVGLYQAALPTANILMFALGALSVVLLPMVSELWARKQKPLIAHAVGDLYKYVLILLLPPAIAILVYPGIVLNILFGASYIAAAPILSVLAIVALFMMLRAVNASVLAGIGRPVENTKAVLLGAGLNLVLNLLFIPKYGGMGAAVSTLISAILIFVLNTVWMHRYVRARIPVADWLKTLLAGAGFLLVLRAARFLTMNQYVKISIGIALGGMVYAAVLWMTNALTVREVKDFMARVLRK